MAQKKKLQVFISSTYTDLQEERQAAVQAILTAGHIPAGMELFAAGDETQMNVIKRWIDESDVYMLILGGRYGSIEPKSQKSYTHLEYEYALEKGKPLFAVVIDEECLEKKVKKYGLKAIEKDHSEKLKGFREFVCGKMVRFWKDIKDIKLSIMETMADFSSREELIGWIPGNEAINSGVIAEEIARLTKENDELKERNKLGNLITTTYNGLTFEEMYALLLNLQYKFPDDASDFHKKLTLVVNKISKSLGDNRGGFIHVLWLLRFYLIEPIPTNYTKINEISKWLHTVSETLRIYGLIEHHKDYCVLTESGKMFLIRLRLKASQTASQIEKYYFSWDIEKNEYSFENTAY